MWVKLSEMYVALTSLKYERESLFTKYIYISYNLTYINCYNGRLPVKALAHRSWPPITKKHNTHILTEKSAHKQKHVQK